MLLSNDTVKAEILCVLKTVLCNYSINSCSDISKLYTTMSKCPVADISKLGPTKCQYLMYYGLAPCLSGLTEEELKRFRFMLPYLINVLIKSIRWNKWRCLWDIEVMFLILL